MRSHLLEGSVRHRRARPFSYTLEHGVYYVALDLDELDEVARGSGSWAATGEESSSSATATISTRPPRTSGRRSSTTSGPRGRPEGWQITLVTNLRMLGYVFNPASFFLCRDRRGAAGRRRGGPQHPRRAPPLYAPAPRRRRRLPGVDDEGASTCRRSSRCAAGTRVHVRDEASRLRITINQEQPEGLVLHTSLDLVRRRLTDRNLMRMLVRHPFVTHKTIGMIHWHALRLWLRGARFHRHREVAR